MGEEVFFNFKSVAVVGASRDENKVGHIVLKNLLANRRINVFPINLTAERILGQKCYKSVLEIPYNTLDLVIFAVKPELIPGLLREAVQKRIKGVVVVSAGFSENGNKNLEEEVKRIALENEVALLGPNVLGFIDTYREINASFFKGSPLKGGISFISQSGAVGSAFLDLCFDYSIGFSGFVSVGNQSGVDFSDFIEHYSKDRHCKVIFLYLESLKEGKGKRFIDVCKKCEKLIYVLKAGKTREGQEAAKTHTGALASEEAIYDGIFRQAGIKQVKSVEEFLSLAQIYSKLGFSKLQFDNRNNIAGKKALVITNAGGLGVLAADTLSSSGIEVVKIPEEIKNKLDRVLPDAWSGRNPIDLLGDAMEDRYEAMLKILDKESWFDFFVVLLTPQYMTQPLATAKILSGRTKPVFACFVGGNEVEEARKFLHGKIPVFDDVSNLSVLGVLK